MLLTTSGARMPPVHTLFVDEDDMQEQKIKIVKPEPGSSALQPIILDRNSDPLKGPLNLQRLKCPQRAL
jgi:hypothetical protein